MRCASVEHSAHKVLLLISGQRVGERECGRCIARGNVGRLRQACLKRRPIGQISACDAHLDPGLWPVEEASAVRQRLPGLCQLKQPQIALARTEARTRCVGLANPDGQCTVAQAPIDTAAVEEIVREQALIARHATHPAHARGVDEIAAVSAHAPQKTGVPSLPRVASPQNLLDRVGLEVKASRLERLHGSHSCCTLRKGLWPRALVGIEQAEVVDGEHADVLVLIQAHGIETLEH